MCIRRRLILLQLIFILSTWGLSSADADVDFNRDIRPILSENCFFCHGPDENTREAGVRLDDREAAIEHGAIAPGDLDASELVARIDHEDADLLMPPPGSHKTLTSAQKQLLRDWIEQGAGYDMHWAFQRIERPEVPVVDGPVDSNPIDAFIRARLADEKIDLSPASRPDRLLRRLSFDLIGLPPTWEQSKSFQVAFEKDPVAAVQSEMDRLFASPHHGERMAASWLDLVRFADTVGYHGDQNQNNFPYRDWVIDSFNQNRRFDDFTISQIAGDLMPNPTTDDLVATGCNRLNMMTREGGAQPGEYLSKYASDRVRTIGMAWLGMTTGCAECHDHKFDPLTAKDFYSLAAFFSDVEQWGVYADYGYTPNPDLRGYNNDFPFPPEIEVVSDALIRRQSEIYRKLITSSEEILHKASSGPAKIADGPEQWWIACQQWLQQNPNGWKTVDWTVPDDSKEKPIESLLVSSLVVDANTIGSIASVQIELKIPGSSPATALVPHFYLQTGEEKKVEVVAESAAANRYLPRFSGGQIIGNVARDWTLPATDATGKAIPRHVREYLVDQSRTAAEPTVAVFQFNPPIAPEPGQRLTIELAGLKSIGLKHDDIEIAVSPMARLRPLDPSEVEQWHGATGIKDSSAKLAWLLHHRNQYQKEHAVAELIRDYSACRDGRTWTMVTRAVAPLPTRVLPRGNWQDKTGELVTPNPPAFLGTLGVETGSDRWTRLELAKWLVDRDNPLTARVVANRIWKHFFGNGLTVAVDDFGAQGDPPSHPALLDYLAVELIDSGWDQRHVMKLILSSRTYQQDSRIREEIAQLDPGNRLLSYHPPRRLEAEAIRDNALAVSGLLNRDIGGPSVKPYQPGGYYSNLQFPDRDYVATQSNDQYRRGIYMHWQRTFLHPMLANFDAPSREDCVAIRANANTPQQALTLLNDPTFIEAAGQLAFETLVENVDVDDESRLRSMFSDVLQRETTTEENERLLAFLHAQRDSFAKQPQQADQLASIGLAGKSRPWNQLDAIGGKTEWAAWTAIARVMLNLHETITRY